MERTTSEAPILSSLTYISRANENLSTKDLNNLLQQAEQNNRERGITGVLMFDNRYFMQTVEGSRTQINHLLSRLIADTRHYDVQLVDSREIPFRSWANWSLNFVTQSKVQNEVLLKYAIGAEFDPYLLNGESILNMMHELC